MTIFALGTVTWLLAFLVHAAWWQVRLPFRHTPALLLLFLGAPACMGLALAASGVFPFNALETLHFLIFYIPCAFSYVILYSAIEQESPTLRLVTELAAAGADGLTMEMLNMRFGTSDPFAPRIALMESGGLITRDANCLRLTPKGVRLARLFALAARCVGLRQGG